MMANFNLGCGDGCRDGVLFDLVDGWGTICGNGGGGCYLANVLSPLYTEEREFHPPVLRGATEDINSILERLKGAAPHGHHLALIAVPGGMMLTWSRYGDIPRDAVTKENSTTEERKRAYGLISSETQAS